MSSCELFENFKNPLLYNICERQILVLAIVDFGHVFSNWPSQHLLVQNQQRGHQNE